MQKKIMYGMFLFFLFSISLLNPIIAKEYTLGIPESAKGVEGGSTIKTYDRGTWKDIINSTGPDDIFGGDADKVGAKRKTKIIDWERDDYDILEDPDVEENIDGAITLDENAKGYGDLLGTAITILTGAGPAVFDATQQFILTAQKAILDAGGLNKSYIEDKWDNNYDIYMIETDKWDYTTEEYEEKPDHEGVKEAIVRDPKDAINIVDDVKEFASELGASLTAIATASGTIHFVLNATHIAVLDSVSTAIHDGLEAYDDGIMTAASEAQAQPTVDELYFLILKLFDGFILMNPITDYLDELLDEWDLDNVKRKDNTIIIDIEKGYEHGDLGVIQKDFTIEITYAETGGQNTVIFKDSDGNEFYKRETDALIPGYVLPILLGITAITAIGLIYILKKRKL